MFGDLLCVAALLFVVAHLPAVRGQVNSWDGPLDYRCPSNGQGLTRMASYHDNHRGTCARHSAILHLLVYSCNSLMPVLVCYDNRGQKVDIVV